MPKRTDIHKILILGSGPIVIGQAAEFDYSGTQALKALRQAGYKLVVVNSNSATIMTDPELSDAVYVEPLTPEFVEAIIAQERPDALLPTLGGQTALNLAVALSENGALERHGVALIGASFRAIQLAEDRELFKQTMLSIGLEVPRSRQVSSLREALETAAELGYPLIARPSFTLGGTGGGIAYNLEELTAIVNQALIESPTATVLLEESVIGWKEYEMEVMRDCADNALIVCSIENLDPMGVHTGDSITVAPAQTLTDREYQRMRDASIAVLRAIGVDTGGSNIQFAVNPADGRMVVIEMNPRVSRSSALASKATGYPIAKVAALLAVGYRLDEIPNDITRRTTAAFEPTLDYVVVKMPRFQLEKFPGTDPRLNTQMKSVGEAMAIGRTFKEALGKAMRSLELDATPKLDFERIPQYLATPTPERLSYVFAALRAGYTVDDIHDLTHIDRWFLTEMAQFVALETELRALPWDDVDRDALLQAKLWGFSDLELGELWGRSGEEVRLRRAALGVRPVFKMVDTCAAEFEAATPYFYSTYGGTENEATSTDSTDGTDKERVIILGSGPNRIGQGIEFDYANVHAVWALQEEGYEVVMVNSNPETVSTDYDTADRLYFEPLTAEDVLAIVENERPIGVVVTFGGQTPLKLARTLVDHNIPLLGMDYGMIEMAEDRKQFGALLDRLGLKSPPYGTAVTVDEALRVAESLGYPVLLRPSYVLGGRAMEIVTNADELRHYITEAARVSAGHPVLIDRFLEDALELDVDILTDGEDVWVAGLMEQIEEAGVHSGDSACVLPPASLSERQIAAVEDAAARLVLAMGAKGLVNLQMAIKGNQLYILEANPRASRTVPFVSKAIGVPLAKLAAKILVGRKLRDLLGNHESRIMNQESANQRIGESPSPPPSTVYRRANLRAPSTPLVSVKEVVLPFRRFPGSDVLLGPEMRSTGEVMSFGAGFPEAYAKSQIAAGNPLPTAGTVLASLTDADKREGIALIGQLYDMGFAILATRGTAQALQAMGIPAEVVHKVGEGRPDCVDVIAQGRVQLVVNTPSAARSEKRILDAPLPASAAERGVPLPWQGARTAGYRIRAAALQYHIPYITTLVALRTAVAAIRFLRHGTLPVRALGAGSYPSCSEGNVSSPF
ncbi:MAG: carbamoyl-phosphate synthase large subunit [Anaerolineae bacterium]